MKFAIQCFGGIRCCQEHRHLENFIEIFPEIFNENNEVDFFILTTYSEYNGRKIDSVQSINYLKNILGNRLKIIEFIEDQPNIIEHEKEIIEKWNNTTCDIHLSLDELHKYREEVLYGIELRRSKNLWLPSTYEELERVDHAINTNQRIILQRDPFVPLLYYRRMLINNIRKTYQKDNNIQYDWIITSRFFDTIFKKNKEFSFLYNPPDKNTLYCSIDNITMTTPEITDNIYENLGNYPVIGYEQWDDEQFKREYSKVDDGIYFLRSGATFCSENQMMWACLKSCNNCIQLRLSNDIINSYLSFASCPNRR